MTTKSLIDRSVAARDMSIEPTFSFDNSVAAADTSDLATHVPKTRRSASESDPPPPPYPDRMEPDGASDPPSGVFHKADSLESLQGSTVRRFSQPATPNTTADSGSQTGGARLRSETVGEMNNAGANTTDRAPDVGHVNPGFQMEATSPLSQGEIDTVSTKSKSSQTKHKYRKKNHHKGASKKNKGQQSVRISDVTFAVGSAGDEADLNDTESDGDDTSPRPSPRLPDSSAHTPMNNGAAAAAGSAEEDGPDEYVSERGMWSGRWEFLFSALSYVIGLGNIWRFPYLCYRNGGGAFLLPYAVFLCLAGLPLVYLEMVFGQYAALGPITIWNIAPVFKGLGIAMTIEIVLTSVYYSVLIAWSFYMFFNSMQTTLPWASCDNSWNTKACCNVAIVRFECSLVDNASFPENTTCYYCPPPRDEPPRNVSLSDNSTDFTTASILSTTDLLNATAAPPEVSTEFPWQDVNASDVYNTTDHFVSPAQEFFLREVLDLSEHIGATGAVSWRLMLCLLLTWILVFLFIVRGVRFTGKIQYLLVVLPYSILIVLLVNSALLDGATSGVVFYFKPSWIRLTDPMVWYDAASQAFFSLSLCTGGLATLASYNKFQHNIYKDAWVVVVLDTVTSILAGFPVFMTMGFIAKQLNTTVTHVIHSGTALAFVAYPAAIARMAAPTLWALLFFLMLLLLGLGTLCISVHTLLTAVVDEHPRRLYAHRAKALALVCFCMFVLGLPLLSQAGLYMIGLLDHYVTGVPLLVFGVLQPVVICWVYGYSRFEADLSVMLGKKPWKWWQLMWQVVTPLLILVMLVFLSVRFEPASYREEALPRAAQAVGWVLVALCLLPIPAYALYACVITPGSPKKRAAALVAPRDVWGLPPHADLDPREEIPDYIYSEEEPSRKLNTMAPGHDLAQAMTFFLKFLEVPGKTKLLAEEGQCGDDIDTGSIQWSEDENKERGNWQGRYDFLMSGLGYTIGIGNVWRFPYLVYKNGGGAFFVPYVLMLVCCGMPIFFLELALGQFSSVGPVSVWAMSPIFKGVGYAGCATIAMIAIYYNVINAWSIFYLFASMRSSLPWGDCQNNWNTDVCRARGYSSANISEICNSTNGNNYGNSTGMSESNCTHIRYTTPGQEYFFREVLGATEGIEHLGYPQWPLCLCLLLSSVITFIALLKGVKSSGKVVYFTVTFPYLILLTLLIRYVTLGNGHLDGLRYYITPKWEKLGEATVWGDAATQLFYSLGLSMGGLIALSSYNRFHYDCYRDAYLICLIDSFTSIFAGFVIFAILGVMAQEAGTDVENVVEAQFTLAYVVYPEAVARLPGAPAWAVLFFLMLVLLAVDSQFLMVQTVIISLTDEFEQRLCKHRKKVIAAVCAAIYVLGLPMVCQGGIYWVVLLDHYVSYWSLLVIGLLTCVCVGWVYTVPAISTNIRAMLGSEPGWFWKVCWKFLSPIILLFILVFSLVMYEPPGIEEWHYSYPGWAHALGVLIAVFPLTFLPVIGALQVARQKGRWRRRLKHALRPTTTWGPALLKHQELVNYLPSHRRPSLYSSYSMASGLSTMASIFTTDSSGDGLDFEDRTLSVSASRTVLLRKTPAAAAKTPSCDKQTQSMHTFEIEDTDIIVVSRRDLTQVESRDQTTQTDSPLRSEEPRSPSAPKRTSVENESTSSETVDNVTADTDHGLITRNSSDKTETTSSGSDTEGATDGRETSQRNRAEPQRGFLLEGHPASEPQSESDEIQVTSL